MRTGLHTSSRNQYAPNGKEGNAKIPESNHGFPETSPQNVGP